MANLTQLPRCRSRNCALLGGHAMLAQRRGPPLPPRPPERYQAALTRLAAMTAVNVTAWRAHAADIPHGEDPALDDSQWTALTLAAAGAVTAVARQRRRRAGARQRTRLVSHRD